VLLFLFIKLRILFRFLFLHTSKDQLVTVVAVIQRTVYAADGGGGSSGLLGNLQICLAVLQHGTSNRWDRDNSSLTVHRSSKKL
jgi:hypothetical protein